jgi:plastocyanin
MRVRPFLGKAAAMALVAMVIGGVLAIPSVASGPSVTIKGSSSYRFAPKHVTIHKGGKVHWHWNSNSAHNVTFKSLGKHSKTKVKGSFTVRFKHKGTFKYLCTIHGTRGSVIVK